MTYLIVAYNYADGDDCFDLIEAERIYCNSFRATKTQLIKLLKLYAHAKAYEKIEEDYIELSI